LGVQSNAEVLLLAHPLAVSSRWPKKPDLGWTVRESDPLTNTQGQRPCQQAGHHHSGL